MKRNVCRRFQYRNFRLFTEAAVRGTALSVVSSGLSTVSKCLSVVVYVVAVVIIQDLLTTAIQNLLTAVVNNLMAAVANNLMAAVANNVLTAVIYYMLAVVGISCVLAVVASTAAVMIGIVLLSWQGMRVEVVGSGCTSVCRCRRSRA